MFWGGLGWVGFGCWLSGPFILASFLFRGLPFGTGHPILPLCRPARLSLSNLRVPVVPAMSFLWCGVGLVFLWFLAGLVFGSWFWLVAGGCHGYYEFFFAAVNRGLPMHLWILPPVNCEGLSAPLPGCWAWAQCSLPSGSFPLQLLETFALPLISLPGRCTGDALWRHLVLPLPTAACKCSDGA